MNDKSQNLREADALWEQFVNSDPELQALEREKRKIEYRRRMQTEARKSRSGFAWDWLLTLVLQTISAGAVVYALLFLLLGLS